MPIGYDDPTGGLPPAPPGTEWPPPHWFDAPAGASPLDVPAATAAPMDPYALGPQPEDVPPQIAPGPPPAPLPPVTDEVTPQGPPPVPAPAPALAVEPVGPAAMPFGSTSQPAPPPVPPPFGPQLPASVDEVPGFTISQEAPPPPPPIGPDSFVTPGDPNAVLPSERVDRAANPFADEHDRQTYLNDLARRDPAAFAEIKARDADEREKILAAARTKAINDDYEQQQRNFAAFQTAAAVTRAKSAQLEADAQRIANTKIDPTGGVHGMKRVAGVLAAIMGGLVQSRTGSARNGGLDALNSAIDKGIDAQRADLANQREGIGMRRSAMANEFAQNGDAYHSAEVMRLAAYKHADALLAQQAQDYDPAGATALKIAELRGGIAAQQQKIKNANDEATFKNAYEVTKAQQEQQKIDETRRHNMAEEGAKAAKLKGGGGAGSNTNPDYTVATGVFDPFTGDPVMGKRALSSKGEKSEERVTDAEIRTYAQVQNYWAKLKTLGEQIGDAKKTLSESAWKARRGTLESEYDAAKEALTVYLTKELGDKLTQGQLEAQAHRIPDRASVFEARDPLKQITDAQDDADRDFATDMNTIGVHAVPIIRHAQEMRAQKPRPDARDQLSAAQQAVAGAQSPSDRSSALAAQQAAKDALAREAEDQAKSADEKRLAESAGGHRALPVEGLPPKLSSEVVAHNEATARYNANAKRYHDLLQAGPGAVKSKLKGDVDAAAKAHEAELGKQARQVAADRASVDAASEDVYNAITKSLGSSDFGGIQSARVAAVSHMLGIPAPKITHNAIEQADRISNQVEIGAFQGQVRRRLDHATGYQKHKLIDAFFHGDGK